MRRLHVRVPICSNLWSQVIHWNEQDVLVATFWGRRQGRRRGWGGFRGWWRWRRVTRHNPGDTATVGRPLLHDVIRIARLLVSACNCSSNLAEEGKSRPLLAVPLSFRFVSQTCPSVRTFTHSVLFRSVRPPGLKITDVVGQRPHVATGLKNAMPSSTHGARQYT